MNKDREIILGYLNWLAKRLGPNMATQLTGADVDEYLQQQGKEKTLRVEMNDHKNYKCFRCGCERMEEVPYMYCEKCTYFSKCGHPDECSVEQRVALMCDNCGYIAMCRVY